MANLAASAMLPALPTLPAPEFRGPTPWSNWVIRNHVLAGAFPASLDDAETDRILTVLLELGMTTFVCLQAEVDISVPEHLWRAGHGLRPYVHDAQRLLTRARAARNPRIKQQKLDFLHLAIVDGSVAPDTAIIALAEDCLARLLAGEKLYIHCWGGHGRTGTLVAILLSRLYNLSADDALRYTQAFHDARRFPQGVRSPQTAVQRSQVKRILAQQRCTAGVGAAGGVAASHPLQNQQQEQRLPQEQQHLDDAASSTPDPLLHASAAPQFTPQHTPQFTPQYTTPQYTTPQYTTPQYRAAAVPGRARAWSAAPRKLSNTTTTQSSAGAGLAAALTDDTLPLRYTPSTSRRTSLLNKPFPPVVSR